MSSVFNEYFEPLLNTLELRDIIFVPYILGFVFAVYVVWGVYISRVDMKKFIIPNAYTYSLFLVGLILNPILFTAWISHYIAAVATLIIFMLLADFTGGIGYGDVKLYTALAVFFGPAIILVIIFSNIFALLAGLIIALIKKIKNDKKDNISFRKTPVPMAPMILLSVILVSIMAIV